MVVRPEKMEVRPRLRLARIISSKSTILGSFDLGLTLSLSLMNSLKPGRTLAIKTLINWHKSCRVSFTLRLLQNVDIICMLVG